MLSITMGGLIVGTAILVLTSCICAVMIYHHALSRLQHSGSSVPQPSGTSTSNRSPAEQPTRPLLLSYADDDARERSTPPGPAVATPVRPVITGVHVKRRASAFGAIGGFRRPNCVTTDAESSAPAESGRDQSSPQRSVKPRTSLATDEIYRVQYRDLMEAEDAVAQSERGERNDGMRSRALPPAPAAPRSDRSLGKQRLSGSADTVAAGQRSARDEEKLELLAMGMLPAFDVRRRSAGGSRSDRPAQQRLRLPPLPVNTLQPTTETARSGSSSSHAQSAFASPASLMWTPNASQRVPACTVDVMRRGASTSAANTSRLQLTSLREYDAHSYDA